MPGEPHDDAIALAAIVRKLPRAYRLGADRVAHLRDDFAALDPEAIAAIAGARFNLPSRCGCRSISTRYRHANAATDAPRVGPGILFGTDRAGGHDHFGEILPMSAASDRFALPGFVARRILGR